MSKPFLELFGVVLIESPWELLIIGGALIGIFGLRRLMKPKKYAATDLSSDDLARQIAVQAMGGSGPMTLAVSIFLIIAVVIFYVLNEDGLWWLTLIPGIPAVYYGAFAFPRGLRLMKMDNYKVSLALFSRDPLGYTNQALEDPEVQKQLRFWPAGLIKFMQKVAIYGVKEKD